MSENELESGEETIDDSGRNPTQQRMDEESGGDRPVDIDESERSPHERDSGQDVV
jgi:hypothetical protein